MKKVAVGDTWRRAVRVCLWCALFLVVIGANSVPIRGQGQDSTAKQLSDIQRQLRELQEAVNVLLGKVGPQRSQASVQVPVRFKHAEHGPALGDANAPVTLIEFADLECPYCRQFYSTTFPEIKRAYIDTGKVRFISRDLPLAELHSTALQAARASRCAALQGKFWELRGALLETNRLTTESIDSAARAIGLSWSTLETCVAARSFDSEIEQDIRDAESLGILGTPAFLIGRVAAGTFEGVKIAGAQPFAEFERAIDQVLVLERRQQ